MNNNSVFVLLGANLGDPIQQLTSAEKLLEDRLGKIIAKSAVYQSEAWGVEDQPLFYNQALHIETKQNAQDTLKICQQIENELGRVRLIKWGSRLIDIDILYFNDDIIDSENLVVPHPYIQDRNFVLMPLNEIAPNYVHPKFLVTNRDLLLNCTDSLSVVKLN